MKFSKNQIIAIIVFIIGFVATLILYLFLDDSLKNIVNFFTLLGTFISLYGLSLAYIQIQNLKEINEETQTAVQESMKRINQVLSVSELSKANKVIQEIQTSLIHQKHEIVLLRMKDLKYILSQVKNNPDLSVYVTSDIYNQSITDLTIDINNINDHLIGVKKNVSFSKINQNLEALSTYTSDYENILKFSTK